MSVIDVVAGVLVDAAGQILLTQRPPDKHLAGYWEFPGGKLEAGESAIDALRRELREELDIEVLAVDPEPIARVPATQHECRLLLRAYRVRAWNGTPHACEGQTLEWLLPAAVDASTLAPADREILQTLGTQRPL